MDGQGEVTRERTRIYVGGLGGGVTEDDLRKTFSALGEVASVDVVRTKGRSFAYLDFLPSSDKSLPKLFSTYNGCMWKGGKLRLEKAKEHYLVRLKREWEEQSQLATKASDADSSISHAPLQKSTKPSAEINKQLSLFFPKLGKVKSLAQVGMGKHKYSFQRIQVPPIPTHFCDCEQHSVLPLLPTKENQISEFDNGINEQELDIMNSVMNKIFQRANPSTNQVIHKSKPVNDETDANQNSEEDHMTDEDNLIINVGTGNDGADLLSEMRSMMANQDAVANKHDGRKKKGMRANRVLINNQRSELVNDESSNIENREEDHKTDEDNLIISLANGSDDVDLLAEMRIMVNQDSGAKIHKGREKKAMPPVKKRKSPHSIEKQVTDTTMVPESSRNKSTWKDLIGGKRNTPLTISDIIPTAHQEKQNESNGDDEDDDIDMKTNKLGSPEKDAGEVDRAARGGSWRQKSSWTQLIGQSSFSISQIVPELSGENHEAVNGSSPPTRVTTESTGKKDISLESKRSLILGNLESEGTCPFMRTETSINEWKRAKTSLNNSPNKTKKSNNGSP